MTAQQVPKEALHRRQPITLRPQDYGNEGNPKDEDGKMWRITTY